MPELEEKIKELPPDLRQESLSVSDFSLGSIGVILLRRKMHGLFLKAVDDLFLSGGLRLIRLDVMDIPRVITYPKKFGLDYDDSYQYSVAEKYNLVLVSYDSDFDRTSRGRVDPANILSRG